MRTFISLNLDHTTKKKIYVIQDNVKSKISQINVKYVQSIKWETIDKFHITLFFLGKIDDNKLNLIDSNLTLLENELLINEINFTMKNVSAFPKLNFPRVLIVDLNDNDRKSFELSNKLNHLLQKIGFESNKAFHPHITLGRVRKEQKINLKELENEFSFDLNFTVKNFYLMRSDLSRVGSKYSVVKEYKLLNKK